MIDWFIWLVFGIFVLVYHNIVYDSINFFKTTYKPLVVKL